MQVLELLSNKLDALLKKYAALEAENKSLKETVARERQTVEMLNSKIATLEDSMGSVQIGKSVADDDDRIALRKQLDGIIGEIDKILTTIND